MTLTMRTASVQQFGAASSIQASRKRCRNTHSLTVLNSIPGSEDRSAALELPHGVLWCQDRQPNVHNRKVLHGPDFVLQRQPSERPGIVLSQRLSSMQLVDTAERERVQIAMYKSAHEETGLQLVISDMFTYDLTDYSLLEESEPADTADCITFPPTACTGIVVRSNGQQRKQQASDQVLTSHSRRTKAVRYTCKLCGTTTTKAVNPHAWATGTVFGRCDGCQVIHKLTDNLELFHELSGSVLGSSISPDSISIPEGLPQKPYMP